MNQSLIAQKSSVYIALTRLNRPIGIYLLMWPMLWALWFAAEGTPDLKVLVIFVLGTILTRSAGCVINDYADRDIDAHVQRTKDRPLATGAVSNKEALGLSAILFILAFGLVLMTNRLTIALSLVALALAVIYPFSKRFTQMPQVVLGAAFSWAIPMAYAAQAGELTRITWLVFLASLLWAVAYDTMYAMADRDDDRRIGVKSSAILFGSRDIAITGTVQYLVLLIMVIVGAILGRGVFYYLGLGAAAALVVYQLYLIRDREPTRCIQAFLNNNYLGMIIFLGIILDYSLVR